MLKNFINPLADLAKLNPQGVGTITVAAPPTAGNGYSPGTPATILLQADCAGIKVLDINPGHERTPAGGVDRAIYTCLIADSTEARQIKTGMYARVVRADGVDITGIVEIVEIKLYAGIRLYIDAGQSIAMPTS